MSSIYKRKRNGKEDGYVMYSTYAFDPLKNKKDITILLLESLALPFHGMIAENKKKN